MFYFDNLNGEKILRSDFLTKQNGVDAFFTTKSENNPINAYSAKRIITPVQTHSDHIEIVGGKIEYPDTDGLILTEYNTAIYLRFADCTPVILYDERNHIGAISHAGWRGTAAKIAVKTIEKMKENFNTSSKDVIAVIGPAISICCYEVSEDVKNTLLSTIKNTKDCFNERFVDLKKINAEQLTEIGVEKIDICPYCTSCNNDLFYSYRKENGTKNRHFAFMELEKINNVKKY